MGDEAALIHRAQQGETAAFEQLIRRYERQIHRLAYRLMGNAPDASDAAQEALVKLYIRLPHFRGESAFSSWVFRVVTNQCLDELRRRKRKGHTSLEGLFSQSKGLQLPTDEAGPESLAERSELQRQVHQAIGRLPADYRAVLLLKDIEGFTYPEIAAILGCQVSLVKSRLHRARLALRQRLVGERQTA